MKSFLIKLFREKYLILQCDPLVFDRWKFIKKHLPKGNIRVLDIGCSSGYLSLFVSKFVKQLYGIDINKKNIDLARDNAKILKISNAIFLK